MRKLQKPTDNPVEVFRKCISRVRNNALKNRLSSVETNIATAAAVYEVAASAVALHEIPTQNDIAGIVSKQEMADVYTNRMAQKGTPGRSIYDKLLSAPPQGRCPLCAQRSVSTLDHHLPKENYPALAVTPINLVPACKDCNFDKSNAIPQSAGEQTLHPYYDDVEGEQWLNAEVVQDSPASVRFFVNPPAIWNGRKTERVERHFSIFKLAALYASNSADELVNIRHNLESLYAAEGSSGVRSHLQDQALSREAAHINSWQTAMYKALVDSAWFCDGGFR